jgi:hypothetical protein
MRLILTILILFLGQGLFGQISYSRLLENKNFKWLADSSSQELTIYYQVDSWTDKKIESVRQRVINHLNSVKSFVDIKSYDKRVHFFIVDSREQMKLLVGHETNGSAFYNSNTVTGVASEKINSIYSNHELFHVVAMNLWGVPDIWVNEGMAVYSDNKWHGHDLYQLTRYLADNNRLVSLDRLIKHFRKVDDLISYPLTGSFVKYLDEAYGRDTVLMIWKSKTKNLKKLTGKTIKELETDWLTKIRTINYNEIKY